MSELDHVLPTLLAAGGLVSAMAVFALLAVYAERKVSAFIQDRLGPMEVGPYGLLQTCADILKLLHKEHITPTQADARLMAIAPVIAFTAVFAGYAVIPFAPGLTSASLNVGLLYLLAVVSVETVGVLMAGWASNNKYALLGSVRSVAQIISYEVPAGLTILSAIIMYGSLDLSIIALQQSHLSPEPLYLLGLWDVSNVGGMSTWGAIRYPHLLLALVIFFIAALAECNRAPFDLPEAESELVAGFLTEYSGFRWAIFFLSEYANMLLLSLLAVLLFLGGWGTPLPNLGSVHLADWTTGEHGTLAAYLWGVTWLLLKGLALVGVMMWIRWTLPRLRPDQLMRLCWKVLTPAALGLLLLSAVWKLAEVYAHP